MFTLYQSFLQGSWLFLGLYLCHTNSWGVLITNFKCICWQGYFWEGNISRVLLKAWPCPGPHNTVNILWTGVVQSCHKKSCPSTRWCFLARSETYTGWCFQMRLPVKRKSCWSLNLCTSIYLQEIQQTGIPVKMRMVVVVSRQFLKPCGNKHRPKALPSRTELPVTPVYKSLSLHRHPADQQTHG